MNDTTGSVVFDNWTIRRLIGEGSYGKVYEITRESFGTYRAALKVITVPQSEAELKNAYEEGMDEQSAHAYFYSVVEDIVREFALMSKLKGMTNVVSYEDHEVIPHKDGIGWDILIRMELLNPLLEYAYAHPFSRRDIIKLGVDLCRALELCQKYNIIHRDIKPENIFVSDSGDFKLGDFGIARTVEKTMSGLSKKGTYSYMAPEVYRGAAYGFGVDIYSLGIVLYRLLNNNRIPFLPPPPAPITYSEREAALAKRMGGEPLPAPANAAGRLGEIVCKACAFDPKERYSSPMALRQELEAIQYDEADAAVIYPSGDELILHENQYVSRARTQADKNIAQETDGGTQSIFGGAPDVMSDADARTESVFGASAPAKPENPDRTESVFGKTAPRQTVKQKRQLKAETSAAEPSTAKKGLWLGLACAAVVCAAGCLFAFRGAVLSVRLDAEQITLERTSTQRIAVRVNRLLESGPYEALQISVSDSEIASAFYDTAQGTLSVQAKQVGRTEITVGDPAGQHTAVCVVTVEPRQIQVGNLTVSEEAETVRFLSCDIDTLTPLLELPDLREVQFVNSFPEDLSVLGQIQTLERIVFQDVDVSSYDLSPIPLHVEITTNVPIRLSYTLGYGEQLSLSPPALGGRSITWESADPDLAWFDEEARLLTAGSVKRNLEQGYDSVTITGSVENMELNLSADVSVGDGIIYQEGYESGSFQLAPYITTGGVSTLNPGVTDCYGFELEYESEVRSGSFAPTFDLYLSADGQRWQKAYSGTVSAGDSTLISVRFANPTDFKYYEIDRTPTLNGSKLMTSTKFTALYFKPAEGVS